MVIVKIRIGIWAKKRARTAIYIGLSIRAKEKTQEIKAEKLLLLIENFNKNY